jgi:gluconolactonase
VVDHPRREGHHDREGLRGKPLNGPNDVWVHPNGGLYLTDPFYKRPWWSHGTMPQDGQHVYYLAPGSDTLVRVTDDLVQPNGIAGTPDGRLAGKTLVCEHGSAGMTLDDEGHLYLTGDGVRVFDRAGRQVEHIQVAEPWTANVSFCGADRRTLFITASKGLYSVRTRTRGADPAK